MAPLGEPEAFRPSEIDELALRELFDTLDRDSSDKIERLELLQQLKRSNDKIRGVIAKSKWLRPMLHPKGFSLQFADMDADGDGRLTFDEFRSYWRLHRPTTVAPRAADSEKLRKIFGLLDRDGSGAVDRREVLSAFQNDESVTEILRSSQWLRPLLQPGEYAETFRSMDLNGDGKISLSEFEEFWALTHGDGSTAVIESVKRLSGWPVRPFSRVTHIEVLELAGAWGIDPEEDPQLLWIVREALETPLPPDWRPIEEDDAPEGKEAEGKGAEGKEERLRFKNRFTNEVVNHHPASRYFEELLAHEREQLMRAPPATFAEGAWMHFVADPDNLEESPEYWYDFRFKRSAESAPSEGGHSSMLMRPQRHLGGEAAVAIKLKRSLGDGTFERGGASRSHRPQDLRVLTFKSWWNEGNSEGIRKRYLEVHFHSDSGNFQVLLDGSDKIYTLSHINGPRGPLQCWDLHVGAKIDILGRKTTLMQANLETTKWIEFHHRRLAKIVAALEKELRKYDVTFNSSSFQQKLRVPNTPSRKKKAGAKLRAYLDDIELLRHRLAHYRPKVADRIVGKALIA